MPCSSISGNSRFSSAATPARNRGITEGNTRTRMPEALTFRLESLILPHQRFFSMARVRSGLSRMTSTPDLLELGWFYYAALAGVGVLLLLSLTNPWRAFCAWVGTLSVVIPIYGILDLKPAVSDLFLVPMLFGLLIGRRANVAST